MMANLFLGVAVMIVCLVLQSLLLLLVLRYYLPRSEHLDDGRLFPAMRAVSGVMVLLALGNMAQAGIWSLLFLMLGEFDTLSEAFYFSAVNFATLGYGDIVMSKAHRVLGPIEAMNGVLMIGLSSATLIAVLQDAIKRRHLADRDR